MNKLIEFLEKRGLKEQVENLRTDDIVLDLRNNEISDDEAVTLAEALKSNNSIVVLDLSNNQISDKGAVALAEALKSNNSITNFDLKNNLIGNDGKKALTEVLKSNYSINYLLFDND